MDIYCKSKHCQDLKSSEKILHFWNCYNIFNSSAIIEHTNQVIFLEDDDVAAVQNGCLTIHRIKRTLDESTTREVTTIKMEIQQIMKGDLAHTILCI